MTRKHRVSRTVKEGLARESEADHPREALEVYAERVDELAKRGGIVLTRRPRASSPACPPLASWPRAGTLMPRPSSTLGRTRNPRDCWLDANPSNPRARRAVMIASPRIFVIGDVMTDVIVRPEGPLARGPDRRAADQPSSPADRRPIRRRGSPRLGSASTSSRASAQATSKAKRRASKRLGLRRISSAILSMRPGG